ncbi:MAG TPA: hypothetical protein EYH00_03085 [Archaeoglobus profundus]|nr:hypothetical protein [Archaeoglobus profundus]
MYREEINITRKRRCSSRCATEKDVVVYDVKRKYNAQTTTEENNLKQLNILTNFLFFKIEILNYEDKMVRACSISY